ncbi:DMT family transporter [Nocardia seriolae]|nr:EamA family transporter [Nocardia seriolae]
MSMPAGHTRGDDGKGCASIDSSPGDRLEFDVLGPVREFRAAVQGGDGRGLVPGGGDFGADRPLRGSTDAGGRARPTVRAEIPRGDLPLLLGYGPLGVAGVQLLFLVAVDRVPVGVAMVLVNLAPAMVALWVRVVRRTRLPIPVWLGILTAVVGLAMVAQIWHGARLDFLGLAAGLSAGRRAITSPRARRPCAPTRLRDLGPRCRTGADRSIRPEPSHCRSARPPPLRNWTQASWGRRRPGRPGRGGSPVHRRRGPARPLSRSVRRIRFSRCRWPGRGGCRSWRPP